MLSGEGNENGKKNKKTTLITFNADTDMMSGQFLRTDNILIVCTFISVYA